MPYVIAEPCINDGSCVEVCPVACIHTTPGASQHYIDPDICIECEQCAVVCPVDAVYLDSDLPEQWQVYAEVNARFFRTNKAAVEPVRLDEAWQMVRAAHAYAAELGIAVSVVVVDGSGSPIAVGRMDAAEPTTAELAFNKAYTAAGFQLPTQSVAPEARKPYFRSLVISSRGRIMAAGGGIPIVDGADVIGAIGVAGGSNEQDILCCRAGLAAVDSPVH